MTTVQRGCDPCERTEYKEQERRVFSAPSGMKRQSSSERSEKNSHFRCGAVCVPGEEEWIATGDEVSHADFDDFAGRISVRPSSMDANGVWARRFQRRPGHY